MKAILKSPIGQYNSKFI